MSPRPLTEAAYPSEFFRREDESEDSLFYGEPRLVVHIDEDAIAAIRGYFVGALPPGGVILDLMSSWRSHLPEGLPLRKVVGLGLNATEMSENPQLDEWVVHDLNADPVLPFDDGSFDAVVVTVSIQYLVRPLEVFGEVSRVLRVGASFHVIYSNRMFPTKAVSAWQALDDEGRGRLVASYFTNSGGWDSVRFAEIGPKMEVYADPVYVVSGAKAGSRRR